MRLLNKILSRPAAPSMPTEKQVRDAYNIALSLHPGVKISRIGPDGVTFDYGDQGTGGAADRPFSAGGRHG